MGYIARMAIAVVAIGATLGGCASLDSVRDAQDAADAADNHAGVAQARADEAYGVGESALATGDRALGVGNNALESARQANARAERNAIEVVHLKHMVASLEAKVMPHHKKKHHQRVAASGPKGSNS